MEYVVIKNFTDKEDKRKYKVGDRYPYRGFGKKERLDELSSKRNMRGEVLIRPLTNSQEDVDKEEEAERGRRSTRRNEAREQEISD